MELRKAVTLATQQIGILIVDDDVARQRALKLVLDAEGCRVRIVPLASHVLQELLSGVWNLVVVNTALLDLKGSVFSTLRELAQAKFAKSEAASARQIRVLFLLPLFAGPD